MPDHEPSTRGSLLLRLRDVADAESWQEFVSCYAPRVYAWCRRQGLQDSDAADATQTVLMKLVQVMQRFDYQPACGRFRSWLRTVAVNVARDLQREWRTTNRAAGDTSAAASLDALVAPDAWSTLIDEIEAAHQWERLRLASQQVRIRVKPHTWQAYHQTVVEGRTPTDVASSLNLPISEVYVAKSRVMKMLRQEVQSLDPGETMDGHK